MIIESESREIGFRDNHPANAIRGIRKEIDAETDRGYSTALYITIE